MLLVGILLTVGQVLCSSLSFMPSPMPDPTQDLVQREFPMHSTFLYSAVRNEFQYDTNPQPMSMVFNRLIRAVDELFMAELANAPEMLSVAVIRLIHYRHMAFLMLNGITRVSDFETAINFDTQPMIMAKFMHETGRNIHSLITIDWNNPTHRKNLMHLALSHYAFRCSKEPTWRNYANLIYPSYAVFAHHYSHFDLEIIFTNIVLHAKGDTVREALRDLSAFSFPFSEQHGLEHIMTCCARKLYGILHHNDFSNMPEFMAFDDFVSLYQIYYDHYSYMEFPLDYRRDHAILASQVLLKFLIARPNIAALRLE